MIKFSIITVCLNAGEDLAKTVENILGQTYENFELIVKDGFSEDGSVEKLPNSPKLRMIAKADSGIYDAMNQAMEVSTGDYLIFMNAGDAFYANTTLEEIAFQIVNPDVTLYYGRCYNEALGVYSNSPQRLTPFFCYRSMLCHQAMIFKREYIQKKRYDCSYRVCADREMLLNIVVRSQLQTQYIPSVVSRYKGAGFCETEENRERIANETRRLREQYFSKHQLCVFRLMITLTLPCLRKKIVNNPKLVKVYKQAVGLIYGNKGEVNGY